MGEIRDVVFQRMLVENNILTPARLQECLAEHQATAADKPFAIFLMEKGAINQQNLEEIVKRQKEYFYYLLWGQKPERFGAIGVREKFFTKEQLKKALAVQRKQRAKGKRIRLGCILKKVGILNQEQIEKILAFQGKKPLYCPRCQKKFNTRLSSSTRQRNCPECHGPLEKVPQDNNEADEEKSGAAVIELPAPLDNEDPIYATAELRSLVGQIDDVLQKTHLADSSSRLVSKVSQSWEAAYRTQYQKLKPSQHSYILVLCSLGTLCALFMLIIITHLGNGTASAISSARGTSSHSQQTPDPTPAHPQDPRPVFSNIKPANLAQNMIYLGRWGQEFASPWKHNRQGPRSFAFSRDCIYVLDQDNARIVKFTCSGQYLGLIALPYKEIEDLAVDEQGNCLLLANHQRAVIVLDPQGCPLTRLLLPTELRCPQRLLLVKGRVYVQGRNGVYQVDIPITTLRPGIPYRGQTDGFIAAHCQAGRISLRLIQQNTPQELVTIDAQQLRFLDSDINGKIFVGVAPSPNSLLLLCYDQHGRQTGRLMLHPSTEVQFHHWIKLSPTGELIELKDYQDKSGLVIIKHQL